MPAAKAKPASEKRPKPGKKPLHAAKKAPGRPRSDLGVSRTIDRHPKREQIIQDLLDGKPARQVAKEIGAGKTAVINFKHANLQERAAEALMERRRQDGDVYLGRIENMMTEVEKMLDACRRWLADPDNPDIYTLDPRSQEIEVVYTECNGNGNEVRAKALLQDLLARVTGSIDGDVVSVTMKQADPRKLILDTVAEARACLELMAKIEQLISDKVTVNVEQGIIVVPARQSVDEWQQAAT